MTDPPPEDSIFSSPTRTNENDPQDTPASSAPEGTLFGTSGYSGPSIDSAGLARWLRTASHESMHAAPFGIVEVDREGTIVFYNETEARFADLDREAVEGKNFFEDVAPCTNSDGFRGRFRSHRDDEPFDLSFSYVLTYRYAPTLVEVRILGDKGRFWMLFQPQNVVLHDPDATDATQVFGTTDGEGAP